MLDYIHNIEGREVDCSKCGNLGKETKSNHHLSSCIICNRLQCKTCNILHICPECWEKYPISKFPIYLGNIVGFIIGSILSLVLGLLFPIVVLIGLIFEIFTKIPVVTFAPDPDKHEAGERNYVDAIIKWPYLTIYSGHLFPKILLKKYRKLSDREYQLSQQRKSETTVKFRKVPEHFCPSCNHLYEESKEFFCPNCGTIRKYE